MSSDTVPRKRVKDKKRKKGNAGDVTGLPIGAITQREAPAVKLITDETIHIQKDADFGGSICSKLIFTTLVLLIGAAVLLMLFGGKDSENGTPTFAESANKHSGNDAETSYGSSLLDQLWLYLPFGGIEQYEKYADDNVSGRDATNEEDREDDDRKDNEEDTTSDNDEDDNTADEDENHESKDENEDEEDKEEENYEQEDDRDEDEDTAEPNFENEYQETDYDLDKSEEEDDDDDDNRLLHSQSFEEPKSYNNGNKGKYFKSEDELYEEDIDYDDADEDDDDDDDKGSKTESVSKRANDEIKAPEDEPEIEPEVSTEPSIMNEDLVPVLVEQNENEGQEAAENVLPENESPSEVDDSSYHSRNEIVQENIGRISLKDDGRENTTNWSNSDADILARESEDSETATSESETEATETDSGDGYDPYVMRNYAKENITNQYDSQFKDELDDADEAFDEGQIKLALAKYRQILHNHPHSVRAKYGVAKSLDAEAELQESNKLLTLVIEAYIDALLTPDVPDTLLKLIAARTVNRMHFKGEYEKCIWIQNLLIDRFPNEVTYRNDLVVTLLTLNRIPEAKTKLQKILSKWPNNGFALVHYGFVLKLDGNLEKAAAYLDRGLKTNEAGTQDGRFYFHLGDALQRLKRNDEARKVYRKGVEKGLFLSEFQRSLYNVNRLTGRPWWTLEQTTYQSFFRELEANWIRIRDEAVSVMDTRMFVNESEQLREKGDWRQYEMFSRGRRLPQCHRTPITCGLIGKFEPAAGCRRGQAKFSIMMPGTHVWPHCGPTNCRLRAHLGLIVPANVSINVAEEKRFWKEGEVFVFDDSFEHEIWHNGTSLRLILIVDVWHPELSAQERRTLTSI